MAKKKNKKKSVKKNKKQTKKCLLKYVLDCSPRVKVFDSKKEMDKFIKNFEVSPDKGDWLDFSVTGITGKIENLDTYDSCHIDEEE